MDLFSPQCTRRCREHIQKDVGKLRKALGEVGNAHPEADEDAQREDEASPQPFDGQPTASVQLFLTLPIQRLSSTEARRLILADAQSRAPKKNTLK